MKHAEVEERMQAWAQKRRDKYDEWMHECVFELENPHIEASICPEKPNDFRQHYDVVAKMLYICDVLELNRFDAGKTACALLASAILDCGKLTQKEALSLVLYLKMRIYRWHW